MSNANADEPEQSTPGPDETPSLGKDLDTKWDQIVAELSDLADAEPDSPEPGVFDSVLDATAVSGVATGPRDWPASAEVEALEDEQSHFQAPTEIDLGEPVVAVRVAWFVIGLVLALAAISFGFGRALSTLEIIGGTAAVAAAVTVLIRNLPEDREDDSDLGAQI